MASPRLWEPAALWPLPDNPYEAPPTATPHQVRQLVQLVFVLLLFPFRLLLVLVPSARPAARPRAPSPR